MPAAAVIPAPIAYIKVAAVKKLVVEFLAWQFWPGTVSVLFVLTVAGHPSGFNGSCPSRGCGSRTRSFTLKKLECLKQAFAMNTLAWNNNLGLRFYFVGSRIEVMIDKESRGRSYSRARGEILGFLEDELMRKRSPSLCLLIKNESWGIEDDQIPS